MNAILHINLKMYNVNINQTNIKIDMNTFEYLKLRQIRCFAEVAKQNSVTKAARTLALSQPSVTRSLRELEEALGEKLLEKDGRGIKLTKSGEVFARHADEALAALYRGILAMEDLTQSSAPPLRIGALPTVSAHIMPDAAASYTKSGARAPLMITTGENRTLIEQLKQGELELVIGRLPAAELMQGLAFDPLYHERVVIVANANHAIFQNPENMMPELWNYPWIIPSKHSIIRPVVDRLFLEWGFPRPSQSIETVSDSFGRVYTQKHKAIWVISEGVVMNELRLGEFQALPFRTDTSFGAVGFHYNPALERSSSAQILIDILKKQTDNPYES